jgi:hypothetical protein
MARAAFETVRHEVDFCVVGGGMAGLTAAVAAARQGLKVALMHERPVLGGNASSECRVHVCGADRHNHRPNMRETGILEEIRLENIARNPHKNFSVWDLVLYETARLEPNITLLLNCSCVDARMDGARIADVTGWQMTTQVYHDVKAGLFADCSGDGILAPLTGAEYRVGREARGEFGEAIAPEQADRRTMGMTILFSAKEYDLPQPWKAPEWAYRYDREEDLPYGAKGHDWWKLGYWWVELGGEHDSVRDTEMLRDELLKTALGVWDHIKNRGDHGADNWALDWLQFLPAKRESRRYVGDHILSQRDVDSEGRFEDIVAYGGWTMDDHHPAGFKSAILGAPMTIWHQAPSPYGIPYRSLYSKNVANLFVAGRCASATHTAMSSTRVMGTGCSMGQAVGTAAAIAVREGLEPRGVGARVRELQQALLRDDCYIPWTPLEMPEPTRCAKLTASQGNPQAVRDGYSRPIGQETHAWRARPGDFVTYEFGEPRVVETATVVLDSALEQNIAMSWHQKDDQLTRLPDRLPKAFHFDVLDGHSWVPAAAFDDNKRRLVRASIGRKVSGVRFTLDSTYGAPESMLFAFYAD